MVVSFVAQQFQLCMNLIAKLLELLQSSQLELIKILLFLKDMSS
jgi:hypothetical protein